jgi:signal transduction histidine kinase
MKKTYIFTGLKLRTKLQLSFLMIGFLSIVGTGWQSYESARTTIETITFDRLTSIRETKKGQIESYFQQIRNQVLTLSEDRMIVEAVTQFIETFHQIKSITNNELAASLQTANEKTTNHIADYRRVHNIYHPILETYRRRFGYDDLFLVDAVSGDIVYSAAKKSDFATNLVNGPYSTANIATVFRETRNATGTDIVKLADFSPYAASAFTPASFIASPIMNDGIMLGVLIFQIPTALINQVMTSANDWKAEGLGETGETYIVGSDFTMRTDSRFFIQEPEEYFTRLGRIGTADSLIQKIRLQKTSILLQQVRTDATIDALRGNTDTKIISDYRGVPVLSSYTPLRIQDVRWVMLSEIDVREAFNSVFILRERLILLGLFILFAAAVIGMLISQTISKPILSLAKATEKFGEGDLSFRTNVHLNDEIGLLASTFNQMAESTMQKTFQLQNEIAERRRAEKEVTFSHQRLKNLSGHLQTVREEERKGLAREIHDELGQALTTLKLNMTILKDELHAVSANADEKITAMMDLIDTTIKSVKRMITALRPLLLDDLGLTAAIEWQAEEFQERTGIHCKISIDPEEITLDAERSTAIFRIFQETLTNIARHAKASDVTVSLTDLDGTAELRISDNGIGVTDEQVNDNRSFGLIGMRERATYWGGSVDIHGIKNQGTMVIVRIPDHQEEHHD